MKLCRLDHKGRDFTPYGLGKAVFAEIEATTGLLKRLFYRFSQMAGEAELQSSFMRTSALHWVFSVLGDLGERKNFIDLAETAEHAENTSSAIFAITARD